MATAYSMPDEFFRPIGSNKIRFHPRKKLPIHRLPFVGKTDPLQNGGRGISFWAVPPTGGYGGGCETGKALAKIYLKHLREHRDAAYSGGYLQHIVLDMLENAHEKSPERDAFCGQVVGFFSVLDAWLEGAALYLQGDLDSMDPKALLDAANKGLNFDYEAYMASLSDDD